MKLAKQGDEKLEKKIHEWSLYGIPALTILGYALLFLT